MKLFFGVIRLGSFIDRDSVGMLVCCMYRIRDTTQTSKSLALARINSMLTLAIIRS